MCANDSHVRWFINWRPIGSQRKTLQENIGRNCAHAPAGRRVPPRGLPRGGDSHEMGGSLPRGPRRGRKRPISQMGGSQLPPPTYPTPRPQHTFVCGGRPVSHRKWTQLKNGAQVTTHKHNYNDLFLINMCTNILLF